jgi:hypothetical protein
VFQVVGDALVVVAVHIEEVNLLLQREAHLRVLGQQRCQHGGAALLCAGDEDRRDALQLLLGIGSNVVGLIDAAVTLIVVVVLIVVIIAIVITVVHAPHTVLCNAIITE